MMAFLLLLGIIAFSFYIEFYGWGKKCPRCNSHKTLLDKDNKKWHYCWVCDNNWIEE